MPRTALLTVLLLLVGTALRVAPLLAGAPVPHPDEFNATFWPLLVALGDPTPQVFYYPYFHTYVLALLQILRGVILAPGDVSVHTWLGTQYFWHPDSALQLARWVNALCGCLTLTLVASLARRIYGDTAAWVALGLASVSLLAVRQSPVAGLDVPMTMWYIAALLAAVRLTETRCTRAYLWAAFLVGLAASTKYHGALAATSILAVHLLMGRSLKDRNLWFAAGAAISTFLAGSPYILGMPGAFVDGFGALVTHARTGLLDLGPGWIHHVLFSLRVNLGWPGLAALAVGLVQSLRNNDVGPRVLTATFLGYYLVVGASPLVFARYALPLAMLQCILAAGAVQWLVRR
ncbi:MAG: glycosyltransferase family 39 protein, partial [bacterium]|nr:glycosyltransferase family 39 protein [bacterium]